MQITSNYLQKRVDISKNVQVEAREIRYTYFHQIANQKKCNYIMTAHHQNDDHETLLLHLIRGSGMKGLKGIPKKRSNIIRPGICFSKKQLLDYAKLNNCLLYTSPSPRDFEASRMPSSA